MIDDTSFETHRQQETKDQILQLGRIIVEQHAEIERLKKEQSRDVEHVRMLTKDLISHEDDIARLKALLARAADALEGYRVAYSIHGRDDPLHLIAELRKAAE